MIDLDFYNSKKDVHVLDVVCDNCTETYTRTKKNIKLSRKRVGCDLCQSCSAKKSINKKPQCSPDFWSKDKRIEHGNILKNSELHIKGLKNRPNISGELNPMYGKKHNMSTIKKMSNSRKGKTGENATAWKGGKSSLVKRLKKYNYVWFNNVKTRDGYTCQHCNEQSNKLDAHHIKPFSLIVKELSKTYPNYDDNQLFEVLKDNPLIIDSNMQNGITLCRDCHRKVHSNWGSRVNPI